MRAVEILEGMSSTGKHGSVHLLDLQLQSNTITAILHNTVARQIAELDKKWTFRPKGGATPDLTTKDGKGIQVKATSDKTVKGNRVSVNEGYFVVVKYSRENYELIINEILMGDLESDDWDRREGTQWAFLKPTGEAKLRKIYP